MSSFITMNQPSLLINYKNLIIKCCLVNSYCSESQDPVCLKKNSFFLESGLHEK